MLDQRSLAQVIEIIDCYAAHITPQRIEQRQILRQCNRQRILSKKEEEGEKHVNYQ